MTVTFGPHRAGPQVRKRLVILAVLAVAGLVGTAVFALLDQPGPEAGSLYFTTFRDQALYKVAFSFAGSRPHFGAKQLVAKLPYADGVTFEPDGDALVGGQNSGTVEEVDPRTGHVTKVPSGCPSAFLVALAPSGATAYTAGLPGPLCAMATDPLRPGHQVALHGDDTTITDVAFDQQGAAFYTSAGNFGVLDLATGTTTRELTGLAAAHGITFDPSTKTLFLLGGDSIVQVDAAHPQTVLSSMTVPDVQFDNGTTDGHGHLFVASNFGQLVVVDYRLTGRLGTQRDVFSQVQLQRDLDDVAPLVGPGAPPAARYWIPWAFAGFGAVLVVSAGVLLLDGISVTSRLPSWDLRRQEAERRHRTARRRVPSPEPAPAPQRRRPGRPRPGRRGGQQTRK
jgi:streptogramin lyase